MKTIAILSILTLASCGTGTMITFGPDGISIVPPAEIVIPTSDSGK